MGKLDYTNLSPQLRANIQKISSSNEGLLTDSKEIIPAINEIITKLEKGDLGGGGGSGGVFVGSTDLERNFLDLLIMRDLEGMSSGADAGYWWDLLLDQYKIDSTKGATVSSDSGQYGHIEFEKKALDSEVNFKHHEIGFVSEGLKFLIDRDTSVMSRVLHDGSAKTTNEIVIEQFAVTFKEV